MNVYKYPSVPKDFKRAIFLFGAFESLHRGHETILSEAFKLREKLNAKIVLVASYDPKHLPKITKLKNVNENFMQLDVRLQTYANHGIDGAVLWDFDYVKSLSLEEFIKPFQQLDMCFFLAGADWKGGAGGKSTAHDLLLLHPNSKVIDIVEDNDKKIGTRVLKQQLRYGDFDFINQYLLSPYSINVKTEGMNFEYPSELTKPHTGIYLVYFKNNEFAYPGVAHLSANINEARALINKEMIENRDITIEFIASLRTITNIARDRILDEDLIIAEEYFLKLQNEKFVGQEEEEQITEELQTQEEQEENETHNE